MRAHLRSKMQQYESFQRVLPNILSADVPPELVRLKTMDCPKQPPILWHSQPSVVVWAGALRLQAKEMLRQPLAKYLSLEENAETLSDSRYQEGKTKRKEPNALPRDALPAATTLQPVPGRTNCTFKSLTLSIAQRRAQLQATRKRWSECEALLARIREAEKRACAAASANICRGKSCDETRMCKVILGGQQS
jgi:hypothetical protein